MTSVPFIIDQINSAATQEEMRKVVQEASDVLVDNGITKAPSLVVLQDKADLVKALSLQFIILRSKAELDQLKNGLQTLDVAYEMEQHPELFKPLFTNTRVELTPGTVCPVHVHTGAS